jgi:hypothetical protein
MNRMFIVSTRFLNGLVHTMANNRFVPLAFQGANFNQSQAAQTPEPSCK